MQPLSCSYIQIKDIAYVYDFEKKTSKHILEVSIGEYLSFQGLGVRLIALANFSRKKSLDFQL